MKIEVLEMEGGVVVIRARSSELFIMPQYVAELKKLDKGPDFVSYFMSQALVNRTARQMFKACLRKDSGLWRKIYDAVQHIEVPSMDEEGSEEKDTKDKTKTESDGMLGFPKAEMTRGAKEADEGKKAKKASVVTKVEADDDIDEEDEEELEEDVEIEEDDDVDSSDDFSDDKELVAQTKSKKTAAASTKKTPAKASAKSKTAKTTKTTKAATTKTATKKTTTTKTSSTAKKTTAKKAEGTKTSKASSVSKTKKATSTKKSK